tara:strand:- start:3338 stop:3697 length:360 start_codon:yes stop_codon:yes gene_type:complete
MGPLLNGIAWIATLAGLAFSLTTSLPESWDGESAQTWLFHASGWLVALLLCIVYSLQMHFLKKKGLKDAQNAATFKQQTIHQEREIDALVRSNNYIFERITAQTAATPRKTARHGEQHD